MEDRINLNIDEENINIHIDETPAFTVEINPIEDIVIELNEQGPAGPRGFRGETGNGIASFELTSSSVLTDTYTIIFTDGNTKTIDVKNGRGISNIELTNTVGLVDTYTITYNDNTTSTFNVTNGRDAIITGANATVSNTVGTPSVNVITNGTPYDRSFTFEFENLKGEQGPQGEQGPVGPQGPEGGTSYGLRGDYSTHYGIEYCQYGLIDNPAGTKTIIVKGGMMLCVPGAETKTTIGSDITYNVLADSDITVFYADGNILEVNKIEYSTEEPEALDSGMLAWWQPEVGLWQFKSNDTGNVWREANATPLADIRINNGVINRIDYVGYRIFNDDIYALKGDVDNLGTTYATTNLSNITQEGIDVIKRNSGGGLEIGDIGIAPLGIDETQGKRRYLNGQLIIQEQYVQFTDKVKSAVALYPSLACTEPEWQTTATMTVGGQVGKFVVDDDAGTIRLPKIIMPIQGLTDLSKLAEIVEAGLPSISHTHTRGTMNITGSFGRFYTPAGTFSGAFYSDGSSGTGHGGSNQQNSNVYMDASRSWTGSTSTNSAVSSIYGNSNTVQQEQIQYPYFIQVATGSETEDNIINEIELNNPFSLLDYKYSEYELNNLSWLRSQGQYNSKAVYPAVYDLLLKIYNGTETKAGVSVKLSTASYTDYDFVLNTSNETFRLPVKVKQKILNAINGNMPVVGNGIGLGLTDGTNNFSLGQVYGQARFYNQNNYGFPVGYVRAGEGVSIGDATLGITKDASKSGLVAKVSQSEVSGLYLYFYVGETVQNANLINAGRIEETVSQIKASVEQVKLNKLDKSVVKAYITQTYVKGTSGYRIWSDKYCEQWGTTGSGGLMTITLLKSYKDTNGTILITPKSSSAPGATAGNPVASWTSNNQIKVTASQNNWPVFWRTNGYLA